MNHGVIMGVIQPAPLRISQKGTQWWAGSLAWRCAGQLTVLTAKAFGKLAVLAERYQNKPAIVYGCLEEEGIGKSRKIYININEIIPLDLPTFLLNDTYTCDGWSRISISGISVADAREIDGGSKEWNTIC
jgi:hypothetical protein